MLTRSFHQLCAEERHPRASIRRRLSWRLLLFGVLWATSFLAVVPVFGAPGEDLPPVSTRDFGEGWWLNPTVTPLCGDNTGRLCAEFKDKEEGSPFTGTSCCVDANDISAGRFADCVLVFSRPPRAEDEDGDSEE